MAKTIATIETATNPKYAIITIRCGSILLVNLLVVGSTPKIYFIFIVF